MCLSVWSSPHLTIPGKRKADELLDFAQEQLDENEHLGMAGGDAVLRSENDIVAGSDSDEKGVILDAPRLVSAEFSRDVYGTDDTSWIKECIGASGAVELETFYRGSISRFRTAWSALVRDDISRCVCVCIVVALCVFQLDMYN